MSSSSDNSPYKTPKKVKVSKKKSSIKPFINEEVTITESDNNNLSDINNNNNNNNINNNNNNSSSNNNINVHDHMSSHHSTPLSNSTSNESSEISVDNETNNDYDDLETMLGIYKDKEETSNSQQLSLTSIGSSNTTVIDICKVYSFTSATTKVLVAFTITNAYGCRDYVNNTMNNPYRLMYWTYIQQLLTDTDNVNDKNNISYLFHKNQRPVTMVSQYPKVLNNHCIESIQDTLDKFINFWENKPDPANIGKKFKINYMKDFNLNNRDKKKSFIFVTSKITLSDRLSLSGQLMMDTA